MNIPEATLLINETFGKLIGLHEAKAALATNILGAIVQQGFQKNILICAPIGLGKSELMQRYAALNRAILGRTPIYFQTGKETGSRSAFVEDVLVNRLNDKQANLYIDEAHETPKGNMMLIRDLTQVSANRRTTTIKPLKDYSVTFDPLSNSVCMGTNEVDKLPESIVSRSMKITLPLYTDEEISAILFLVLRDHGVTFNENTLALIASCCRGTARDVIKWGDTIRTHLALAGKLTINKLDVTAIIKLMQTLPTGVTKNELQTLLLLESDGDMQLKGLAARMLCSSKEQNANEMYLHFRGYLEIDGKRHLTAKGRAFLAQLRKDKFLAE